MTFYLSSHPFQLTRRIAARQHAEGRNANHLAVDVREQNDEYIVTAMIPGISAESLNIEVLEDVLTISGNYAKPEAEYLMNELPAGDFRRSLRFPLELDAEKTTAHIENGVLTLQVAKAESVKPRSIPVTVR